MERYQQNYFFLICLFKDAKSCHVFFLLLLLCKYIFLKRLGHIQFEINLYFLKERFVVYVERNQFI
jgi:hypothetical protein